MAAPDSASSIPLWDDPPFFDEGHGQAAPHLVPFLLPGPNRPCVVVCPGGGYRGLAEHEGEPVARWLNELGYSALVLMYRVFPYQHPVAFVDGRRAVRLLRAKAADLGIDHARIAMLGFSAGGHLAAHVGTCFAKPHAPYTDEIDTLSGRPDALILCYPVISPEYVQPLDLADDLVPDDHEDPDEVRLERQVSAETPPSFLWHTADDPVVHVLNVLRFAEALRRYNVEFALHVFPRGGHGVGLARNHPDVSAWTGMCARWLESLWVSRDR